MLLPFQPVRHAELVEKIFEMVLHGLLAGTMKTRTTIGTGTTLGMMTTVGIITETATRIDAVGGGSRRRQRTLVSGGAGGGSSL
jgi:hypothetical protein